MVLTRQLLSDIIEWDVVNWSKCLRFFENSRIQFKGSKAIAIGERHGGLSLWLALQGADVLSTDLNGVSDEAKKKHQSYSVSEKITYSDQNILSIGYPDNSFDIVMFKSVIGALGKKELQQQAISEIRRVLKPGGVLLFAENLVSSPLHGWLRKRYIKWASYWRYITIDEAHEFCRGYSEFKYDTAGFLGTLGRTESQRELLGKVDGTICRLMPRSFHYILFGVARK